MFNDTITLALEKAISASSLRHQAILNNISNVNTVGYKRVDVNFKSELANIFNSSTLENKAKLLDKLKNFQPDLIQEKSTSIRNDGSNVDIDKEMSVLAKNSLEYEFYISMLAKKFSITKTVVNEGRK